MSCNPLNMSQPRSFQIQQDDKFFSRLLSKESSMANPSSRLLYYANRPSSVPFLWESQPGTRKPSLIFNHDHDHDHDHPDHDDDRDQDDHDYGRFHVPPLTPPPSYYTKHKLVEKFDTSNIYNHKHLDRQRRDNRYKRTRSSGMLSSLFPRKLKFMVNFGLKMRARQWISSSSEGSGSVIDSVTFRSCSTTTASWFSSSALSFDSREEEEEDDNDNNNTCDDDCTDSRVCFGCYRG